MKTILPNPSNVIKERGRNLSTYNFSYNIDFDLFDRGGREYSVPVNTSYIGSNLYEILFEISIAKDGSVAKFKAIDCNCPHDVPVCKHLYGAMYRFSLDRVELKNLYEQCEREKQLWNDDVIEVLQDVLEAQGIEHQEVLGRARFDESSPLHEMVNGLSTINQPRTSYETEKLLNMAIAKRITQFERPKYKLIPELIINDEEWGLKLKVNILGSKSYVIKDIYELPQLFELHATREFGTSQVDFVCELFEDQSLVNYLLPEIKRAKALLDTVSARGKTDWYGYYTPGKVKYDKKQLQLTAESLFGLCDLLTNNQLKLKYQNERLVNYQVIDQESKFELEYREFNEYVTLESKAMLELIQAGSKIIAIDRIKCEIRLCDAKASDNAQIICLLLNSQHIVNHENARKFEKLIIDQVADYINLDYDVSSLYSDDDYIGLKTHVELLKDSLTVELKLNLEAGDNYDPQKFDELTLAQAETLLATYDGSSFDFRGGNKLVVEGVNNIIDFIQDSLHKFEQISEVMTSNEEFKQFKIVKKADVSVAASHSNNSTILKFESSVFSDSELLEVLQAYDSDEEYLHLSSGTVVDLTATEVQSVIETANKLDLDLKQAKSTEMEISLASIFYYNRIFEALDIESKSDEQLVALVDDYNKINTKSYRKPKKVECELRKYQKQGINWLEFLEQYNFGGILADDMGLGKTLQVISHLAKQKSKLPSLVITPASLVYNWKHEFAKFTPSIVPLVIDGAASYRKAQIAEITDQMCIISYDSFKRDFEQFSPIEFNYVILDEAQHIKNANTKIAKAVKAAHSTHRLALTGTPIENNLNDLWSLFEFVMPGYLGTIKQFKRKYMNPIENGDKEVQAELKRKVMPFIMRRLKSDVLTELPNKTEKVIHIQMDEKQHKLYDAQASLIKNFLDKTNDEELKTKQIEILAMITKLRQIACNPKLVNPDYSGESAKQEYLTDHLQTLIANGHKTVLFSQFVSNFDYLEMALEASGISYYKITGATPKQKRYDLVEEFNSDDTPLFLISLKAGGTGLNITGADTVIHYDPWWNTAVESQATDRVHRMGQKNSVFVYKLICEHTIEEQIVKLQEQKRQLAENLLESDQVKSSSLTKEDIFNLF